MSDAETDARAAGRALSRLSEPVCRTDPNPVSGTPSLELAHAGQTELGWVPKADPLRSALPILMHAPRGRGGCAPSIRSFFLSAHASHFFFLLGDLLGVPAPVLNLTPQEGLARTPRRRDTGLAMSQENVETVRRNIEAWNRRDLKQFLSS